MTSFLRTLRAYAELGRVSNLPTTFSNVLVGCAIGSFADPMMLEKRWIFLLAVWFPIACFYVAGMAMNDLFDAHVDLIERPHRPIPSGHISRRGAGIFIAALIVLGLAALSMINTIALGAGIALVFLITFYNASHLRFAASVLLLGLARGMIYVVGAAAVSPSLDWPHIELLAGAIAAYTVLLSLIARREMQPHAASLRYVSELLPFIAVLPLFVIHPMHQWRVIMPLVLAMMWLSRGVGMYIASPTHTRQAVMIWISGICLIDAVFLVALQQVSLATIALVCFICTTLAQRRIAGT